MLPNLFVEGGGVVDDDDDDDEPVEREEWGEGERNKTEERKKDG
jgi:hypothetical protein